MLVLGNVLQLGIALEAYKRLLGPLEVVNSTSPPSASGSPPFASVEPPSASGSSAPAAFEVRLELASRRVYGLWKALVDEFPAHVICGGFCISSEDCLVTLDAVAILVDIGHCGTLYASRGFVSSCALVHDDSLEHDHSDLFLGHVGVSDPYLGENERVLADISSFKAICCSSNALEARNVSQVDATSKSH